MNVSKLTATLAFALTVAMPAVGWAEETVTEKMNTGARKAADNTKETARNMSDKVCEMVNGKEKCVWKKMKHGAANMKDDAATKAKEVKDKVD